MPWLSRNDATAGSSFANGAPASYSIDGSHAAAFDTGPSAKAQGTEAGADPADLHMAMRLFMFDVLQPGQVAPSEDRPCYFWNRTLNLNA
jgi:hypothetical protein